MVAMTTKAMVMIMDEEEEDVDKDDDDDNDEDVEEDGDGDDDVLWLQNIDIPLSSRSMDILMNKLDINRDGHVDYE